MQKAYTRIIWINYPSTDTPLNESNLNRMDLALDTIDDRVVNFDTTKANQTDLLTCLSGFDFNTSTGVITITLKNGTQTTYDTGVAKVVTNWYYDNDPTSPHFQDLVLRHQDGTYQYVDLSSMVTNFEFGNTSTVAFTVSQPGGIVTANVVDGSITESKLQPNFLADCRAAKVAAEHSAEDSEAWAVGTRGGIDVDPTDPTHENNSKYYAEQAEDYADDAETAAGDASDILDQIIAALNAVTFTVNYTTGEIEYTDNTGYSFSINTTTGNLEWEVVIV